MVEFVGNWGERPESAVARWRNDVTAAKELCYPKEVVRNIFGYDCFVEETEEEIKIVRKLYDLLVFSMEPDDLNEQLKELESEDPKTCTFIYRFIKTKLNK